MEFKTLYLDLATKREIINTIINNCIVDNNGIISVDYIQKQLATDLALLQFYSTTDIDNIDMDILYKDGVIDEFRREIPEIELNFIEDNVRLMLNEKKETENSLASILNKNLKLLISKIPTEKEMSKLLKNLPRALEKVSPETMGILKDISNGKIK
jgi:hypothetical protein